MRDYEKTVPGDRTYVPGMHTLWADKSQRGQVNYCPNVEYVQRDGKPLHLQILLPDGLMPGMTSTLRYPLVVYVQGSAWGEQNVYRSLPQLCPLAQAGFVVASVKHRPSQEAPFPAFLEDVKSAIRFLRAHGEEYFIDPNQVAIWGIPPADTRPRWWVSQGTCPSLKPMTIGNIPMLFRRWWIFTVPAT